MSLKQRLTDDMKTAMKSGQKERLQVIRMLLSDVKNIDLAPQPTTEEQAVAAYAKKLRKAAEEYQKIGKQTEVDQLHKELAIVEEYLPKKADTADTEKLVDAFLQGKTFTPQQLGQAMGQFMKAHGKEVDPALANQLLKKRITGQ